MSERVNLREKLAAKAASKKWEIKMRKLWNIDTLFGFWILTSQMTVISCQGASKEVSLDHTANMSMFENPPPSYYSKDHNSPIITTPQLVGMHLIQPTPSGTSVVVTQPVVTVQEPPTTCSLVCAVLSSIFCCFICGLTGIFIAWKARLYVLEKKYEQARHSVSIVWLLFGLAIFFGLVTWGLFTFFVILPFHYALANSYQDYRY